MDEQLYRQGCIDLAAALRECARLGLNEGVCNHFSLALDDDHFLINPQGLHWSEVGAGDILLIDGDGKLIRGRHTVEPTAFFIHSHVHRAKPTAACVLHTHMPYATSLTLLKGGRLEMVSQNALRFFGRIAYDEHYNGLALDAAEGERIAHASAKADVVLLSNHGVIVTGPSVAWAFDDLYYLERACMLQVIAQSTGRPLHLVPERIVATTAKQMAQERQQSDLMFAAVKRMLDRDEPGWSVF